MPEKNVSRLTGNPVVRRVFRLAVETACIVLIAAVVGAGVLYWRLTQGPINLALIKPQLESALTRARDGRAVTMNRVTLEWSQDRARIEIAMSDVVLYGADSRTVAIAAKDASVILRSSALLFGRIEPLRLRLENGAVHTGASMTQDSVVETFAQSLSELRALLFTYTLSRFELSEFTVSPPSDAPLDWSMRDVSTVIAKRGQALAISARGNIVLPSTQADRPVEVIADLTVNPDGSSDSERIEITDASFATFQSFLPALPDFGYDGAIWLGLSFSASPERIDTIGVDLKAQEGSILFPGLNAGALTPVSSLEADVSYDLSSGVLTVIDLAIDSEPLAGNLAATVEIGPSVDFQRPFLRDVGFKVSARDLRVGIPQLTSDPVMLASAGISGRFSASDRSLSLSQVRTVHSEGFTLGGFVRAVWPEDAGEGPVQVAASLSMTDAGSGGMAVQRGIGLIPVGFAVGFRSWADRHIRGGVISRAALTINCSAGPEPFWRVVQDCMTLDLAYTDMAIDGIGQLPAITGISGRASVRDRLFGSRFEAGRIENWAIGSGKFELPLVPSSDRKGFFGHVEVDVSGPLFGLDSILGEMIADDCQSPDQRRPATGVGEAKVTIDIYRSGANGIELELSVAGKMKQASRHNILPGMHLTGADLDVFVRNGQIRVSGVGLFDGSQVRLEWTNGGDDARLIPTVASDAAGEVGSSSASTLKAGLSLDIDQLRRAGLPDSLEGMLLSGRTAIDVQFDSSECRTDVAVARLDLSDAELRLPFPGWSKDKGEPASGAIRYGRNPGGDSVVTVDIRASGLSLVADLSLGPGGELSLLSIERAFARDGVDVSGRLRPDGGRGYVIDLKGPVFDAGSFIDQIRVGRFGKSKAVPIEAAMEVSSLTRNKEEFLRDASVSIKSSDQGLQNARISGRISGRGDLKFALDTILVEKPPTGTEADRIGPPQMRPEKRIKLRSDDAGRVIKILTGRDIVREGEIAATAEISQDQSSVLFRVYKGRVYDLPVLAQVLSLASLGGLVTALSGEGILFTNIEVPIRVTSDRVDIIDARASGSALGITASGWVVNQTGELSLNGYIVPSFGINAALGGIPIIGDLFVSRSGEGVFAISYTVSGTLDEAQARIEPLSLLTPGILRRAFENAPPPPTLASRAVRDSGGQDLQVGDDTASDRPDAPDPEGPSGSEVVLTAPSRKPIMP